MSKNLAITILFLVMFFPKASFAALGLSINPVDGSSSLRFDPAAQGEGRKEIHVRINSTNGERYQVFQQMLEPMINENGTTLNFQALETQTLLNSSSAGTLYVQNPEHLGMGEQLLYSSNPAGQGDSFIVGYTLNQNFINAGGTFRGRLIFTVRGQGSGSSDQVIIDVFLVTASNFKISVKASHAAGRIKVDSASTTQKNADFVQISFSGNGNQDMRIYQQVDVYPQNEEQRQLGKNVLQLDAEGNAQGLRLAPLSPINASRTLIYSGSKSEDNFIIYFLVDAAKIQLEDAGIYSGRLKYIVETPSGTQEFPIDIQVNVEPVFTMNVTMPPGGMSFSHVMANSPPQEREVLINVVTNLHKPYQVLQGLDTGMTNPQGKEINNKYLTLQVQILPGQRGQSDFTEFSPMKTGEYPVFSSDARGSGATFKLLYRLEGYDQMDSGNFLAPIRLSLNQK